MFNVPKGNYKNPRIVDEENLYKLSSLLPKTENIRNTQFDSIEEIEKGDLVYFDPPYRPLNQTSSFTSYTEYIFGDKEQMSSTFYLGAFIVLFVVLLNGIIKKRGILKEKFQQKWNRKK